ncbi:UDP-galactopyranose/dTDP-fucopyranose mutase family protein [Paracoccus ravus]|uniref:UDP-galactopyranose/dTDP-fucopyranose mutase family protein n=1 Tax=Paracoccus ravus TaxID=2447760 RepID=UPI00106EF310|nr:UDP-galactopyranose mutase [Paracoccus ravus]
MKILVVGAGLSGAVIARQLAEAGYSCHVIDQRAHPAGNCHTERDPETGIMVHRYGPHIFHTDDLRVWTYVNRFAEMMAFDHRVKITLSGRVHAMPINLLTINQFFGTAMRPDEARAFCAELAECPDGNPGNFEEQALSLVGRGIYEAFFKGYTEKQWGCAARDLPASVLKRLPLRFDYNDRYFAHKYQGIPRQGYTDLTAGVLDHPRIRTELGRAYRPEMRSDYDHLFWTGKLDEFFDFRLGDLAYRTLDFEEFRYQGDYQGCAVMNYADADVPYTRITEHKHFAPWESHSGSVCYREYSRAAGRGDTPYYPIRLAAEQRMLAGYEQLAAAETHVTFLGRLGTYAYLDMDMSIAAALAVAEEFLARR